jgi:GNAT superfamily N-acetyltransferase
LKLYRLSEEDARGSEKMPRAFVLAHGRPNLSGPNRITTGNTMIQDLQLIRVTSERVGLIAPLFNAYRQFYGQKPDPEGARQFLLERLHRGESVIFAVIEGENALGFTQLYPSFSSVSMRPIWILNDLFVIEKARRRGIGARLLMAARDHAMQTGSVRLVLSTAVENLTAQALYEQQGWKNDTTFLHYEFELPRATNNPNKAE